MHPDGYFALVLEEPARELLLREFLTLREPIAHHCTVRYGTQSPLDLPPAFSATDIGRLFSLKVIGRVCRPDRGVEAVVVGLVDERGEVLQSGFSENDVPHITIATDGVAEPVIVNEVLREGFSALDGPVLLAKLEHTRASSKKASALQAQRS